MKQASENWADEAFVIATGNAGKRREFEVLLKGWLEEDWQVFDRSSFPEALVEVEESGDSYVENGIKKAMETAQATGCCALADDSGLEVDALNGAPGVWSARYAGEDASDQENNRKLMEAMEGVEQKRRGAKFVAALCLALPDNRVARQLLARRGVVLNEVEPGAPRRQGELVRVGDMVVVWFQGVVQGRILKRSQGDGGFGYDPYFWVPELGKSMAEATKAEKNRLSHRAMAVQSLRETFTKQSDP